jgi:hypothetical protein
MLAHIVCWALESASSMDTKTIVIVALLGLFVGVPALIVGVWMPLSLAVSGLRDTPGWKLKQFFLRDLWLGLGYLVGAHVLAVLAGIVLTVTALVVLAVWGVLGAW